jgi:hypothetical protein
MVLSNGTKKKMIGVILPVDWGYIFETKIVAYGAFDETVCTAPLGPI